MTQIKKTKSEIFVIFSSEIRECLDSVKEMRYVKERNDVPLFIDCNLYSIFFSHEKASTKKLNIKLGTNFEVLKILDYR